MAALSHTTKTYREKLFRSLVQLVELPLEQELQLPQNPEYKVFLEIRVVDSDTYTRWLNSFLALLPTIITTAEKTSKYNSSDIDEADAELEALLVIFLAPFPRDWLRNGEGKSLIERAKNGFRLYMAQENDLRKFLFYVLPSIIDG